jgi:hypothetical protein
MSDENKSFGRTAEKLSRNPLGIIALFIVLAHAFASSILAFSSRLQNGQQWALILFVVLFPLIVLTIFTYLVVKHHIKLYAPADFRSDESFLKSVSPSQLTSESIVLGSEISLVEKTSERIPATEPIVADNKENTNNGTNDGKPQRKTSIVANLLAKDLVLRRIETSFNEPVRRQSAVTALDGNIRFDGVIIQDDLVTGIKVLFFKDAQHISMDKIDSRFYEAIKANNHLLSIGRRFNFILVVVVDDESPQSETARKILSEKILDRIANKFTMIGVNVQVQVLTFGLLKEEFSIT